MNFRMDLTGDDGSSSCVGLAWVGSVCKTDVTDGGIKGTSTIEWNGGHSDLAMCHELGHK